VTRRVSRHALDDAFPTLVRYAGFALAVGLGAKLLFFGGVEYPSLGILAAGMILYKTVAPSNGGRGRGGSADE
jgi:hypothetical protein